MNLFDYLAFDEPFSEADPFGGTTEGWAEVFQARATIIYQRGGESVEAARLAGRSIYKVRIRQSADARRVTTEHHRGRCDHRSEMGVDRDRGVTVLIASTRANQT
ncbi:head-tail adaptor protein [Roseovarius sp. SCSIO 43702]|uniref:phage head completion protein n=1 Tax=Roseovarius sp. SCSIO 43702 TaxID=2823043 RepID=UPI001C730ACB|nr:head-tail adaptor protein [Roseovarius sp. SCSIO 43702]QYX58080.1 head-tail adaptor protein [Roseovarius sp. SCSIO 43702]